MGLPALKTDYLFIGPLLVSRLQTEVPDLPVDLCERPEQVLEVDRRARVLMVMWAGDRFSTGEGRMSDSATQVVYQRWLVVLGINNVGHRDARNADAGRLLSSVHYAVAGWKPEGCPRALLRANSPLAPVFTKDKGLYPLGFEISLSL